MFFSLFYPHVCDASLALRGWVTQQVVLLTILFFAWIHMEGW